jgi:hypothetical protein
MDLTLVFFLIGLLDNVLFFVLYPIPVCSEGNIVNHIFAKHDGMPFDPKILLNWAFD